MGSSNSKNAKKSAKKVRQKEERRTTGTTASTINYQQASVQQISRTTTHYITEQRQITRTLSVAGSPSSTTTITKTIMETPSTVSKASNVYAEINKVRGPLLTSTFANGNQQLQNSSFKRANETFKSADDARKASVSSLASNKSGSPLKKTSENIFSDPRRKVSVSAPRMVTNGTVTDNIPQTSRFNMKDIRLEDITGTMPIKVHKTSHRFVQNDTHVPMYKTNGPNRGQVLIINNINFKTEKTRQGAAIDQKNLAKLFRGLNIKVTEKQNLTGNEMRSCLASYAKGSQLKNVDMCFVVIMSHGTGSFDKVTQVSGIDDGCLYVSDIVRYFSDNECPNLKGKPKIFIFQCCRGSGRKEEFDAVAFYPECEDMLLAFSTLPGFPAVRNIETGSYYVQAICKVFMKHACDTELLDMLIMVQETLKTLSTTKQTSSYENLGFKKCYLNP